MTCHQGPLLFAKWSQNGHEFAATASPGHPILMSGSLTENVWMICYLILHALRHIVFGIIWQ